jgi:hypothetical protein
MEKVLNLFELVVTFNHEYYRTSRMLFEKYENAEIVMMDRANGLQSRCDYIVTDRIKKFDTNKGIYINEITLQKDKDICTMYIASVYTNDHMTELFNY